MRRSRRRRRTSAISGKALFVLVVVACVILFTLYWVLFRTQPQQQETPTLSLSETLPQTDAVQAAVFETPTETNEPIPEPTPEPTPGLPDFDISSWEFMLANASNPLDEDFAPEELTEIADNERVDSRIAEPIRALLNDAYAAGYTDIYFCSGYRDYDTQYAIYWNAVWTRMNAYGQSQEEAEANTRLEINPPGSSEHQLGTTADILEYYGQDMEPYIGGSGLMLWLEEHCVEYGFIIRYPEDKTEITGVEYEPWHLRYVGVEAAKYITENGLCLEEFLAMYE